MVSDAAKVITGYDCINAGSKEITNINGQNLKNENRSKSCKMKKMKKVFLARNFELWLL